MSWSVDSLTYPNRKKLTISQTVIDTADLTDFTWDVILTSTNFDFSKSNADGFDIRFTAADGTTLLKYDRIRHDSANSLAEYKVKIPTIDYDADTDFYMYFRTDDTADGADKANAYDSSHKRVYTMNDLTTSTIEDRLGVGNGTKVGANEPIECVGKVGKGQDFDGSNDYINLSAAAMFGGGANAQGTIELLFKMDELKEMSRLYAYDKADAPEIKLQHTSTTNKLQFQGYSGGGYTFALTEDFTDTTSWHHLVGTFKTNEARFYLDGAEIGTADTSCSITDATPNEHQLGDYSRGHGYFNGQMDEVAIHNSSRGANWVKAKHASLFGTALTYGETEGGETTVVKDLIMSNGIIPFAR
jgi:hypothetical protein